ncbi:hypothetical protein BC936DRAFT_149531 [Jimgerdemannia flammicorona]|uniref:Peroxisomal ATPase PEX1 n=1 Tax=Jimgerdemannia flammicorona TaxID=994334 RepID=A0A433DN38_9FUNG|nr:hypothetical protein BC936DRAFT_149531 [Jimgerdemannia flammicorona]
MIKQIAISFVPIRSCLVNLPPTWVPQNVTIELSWTETTSPASSQPVSRKAFVGWTGGASIAPFPSARSSMTEVLEIDPQFGQAIGLQNGQKVNLEFSKNIVEGVSINVEPYSEDDWEILEQNAGNVEENLLSQIRVVYPNQIITVWIHGRTLVRLKVAELNPKAPCIKLTTNSEVIVAPKLRHASGPAKTSDAAEPLDSTASPTLSVCLRHLPTRLLTEPAPDPYAVHVSPSDASRAALLSESRKFVRLSRLSAHAAKEEGEKQDKDEAGAAIGSIVYAKVKVSPAVPRGHVVFGEGVQETLEAEAFAIIRLSSPRVEPSPPPSLVLRPITQQSAPSSLKLGMNQRHNKTSDTINAFKDWTTALATSPSLTDLILTHGMIVRLPIKQPNGAGDDDVQHAPRFVVHFGTAKTTVSDARHPSSRALDQATEAVAVMTPKQLEKMQVEIGENLTAKTEAGRAGRLLDVKEVKLGGVEETLTKMRKYLKSCLTRVALRSAFRIPGAGGILLSGAHGSGKTAIVRELLRELGLDMETLAYVVEVNCSESVEDRIPTFKEKLQQWFDEAALHAPSIVFFDDLDRLIPAELEHADSFRSRQLAELFLQVASHMKSRHRIAIVATAQQQTSVHPSLITSHLFSELVHLNPPGKNERKQILETIMTSGPAVLMSSVHSVDLVSVASNTEGYLAADLKAVVERAMHEGAVRNIRANVNGLQRASIASEVPNGVLNDDGVSSGDGRPPTSNVSSAANGGVAFSLTQQDFDNARRGFVPSSLRGVKLQTSEVSWADIGGLNETRRTLLETLEWPTKYASIFANCPLRLRSGLLLYGFPGCGKTLLASAVAKECGLNFISVKGPELLNKYIGASEKSVRDLFERAQAARPCVLFFDEFDSIAPRRYGKLFIVLLIRMRTTTLTAGDTSTASYRGHDSTGVTDRVVNQMLTQMDGAEGLDGVYVLAATSRPDLIDPALLRPGRLDKSLLCGMPDINERLEILQSLSRKMTLSPEVDLEYYAGEAEGFSGADLQAFLYNAHLEAIHNAIHVHSFEKDNRKDAGAEGGADEELTQFTTFGAAKNKPTLTQAEKGHILQRLNMIKKGYLSAADKSAQQVSVLQKQQGERSTHITTVHLDKSIRATRPSNTPEERRRLEAIYHEFVTGRTGEMPTGEGAKGIGKRTTLG